MLSEHSKNQINSRIKDQIKEAYATHFGKTVFATLLE